MFRQIQVFLLDSSRIGELMQILEPDLLALSRSEVDNLTIFKIIVKDVRRADTALTDSNFMTGFLEDLVAISVRNDTEGIGAAISCLANETVNIESLFSFPRGDEIIVVLEVREWQKATRIFWDSGIKVLKQEDFLKLF